MEFSSSIASFKSLQYCQGKAYCQYHSLASDRCRNAFTGLGNNCLSPHRSSNRFAQWFLLIYNLKCIVIVYIRMFPTISKAQAHGTGLQIQLRNPQCKTYLETMRNTMVFEINLCCQCKLPSQIQALFSIVPVHQVYFYQSTNFLNSEGSMLPQGTCIWPDGCLFIHLEGEKQFMVECLVHLKCQDQDSNPHFNEQANRT